MSGSDFASRDDFLALASGRRRFDSMLLPVSGLAVRFRNLSEAEYAEFQMSAMHRTEAGLEDDDQKLRNIRARLIVLCLCDDEGNPVLNDSDVETIGRLDAGDSTALYDRLREHCGLNRRKSLDELKKTSNRITGSALPTSSPPTVANGTSNGSGHG